MTSETKELIIRGLGALLSDDLARAKGTFRGLGEEEMNQPWGSSGKTRKEILQEYQARHDKIQKAMKEVEAL